MAVEVEDRGVGIPPVEVDEVFERFHRGGGEASRSVRKSGPGLTLVKEIVDAHGGAVHAWRARWSDATRSGLSRGAVGRVPDDRQHLLCRIL